VPIAWPVEVVALEPISCGSVLWRMDGGLRLTVIVKATLGLVHDGTARLIAPLPLTIKDAYRERSPTRSLEAAADLAPYLPAAGAVVSGHAYAPPGQAVPAMSVRFAVVRGQPLVDKTLHVFGDRSAADPGHPKPFARMPIVYERAHGGAGVDANPVGVGAGPDAKALPNVIDPADGRKPAGFGPIARLWQARRRLVDAGARKLIEQPVPEITRDFPWGYFQAAPSDQVCDFLAGDEWIILDGMHPALPRVTTRLPGVHAAAHVHSVGPSGVGPATVMGLVADTLTVDADQQCCSIVWRGVMPVASEAALAALRVFAAVELPGQTASWPSVDEIAPASSAPAPPPSKPLEWEDDPSQTRMLSVEELDREAAQRPILPFPQAPPPPAPAPRSAEVPPPSAPVAPVEPIEDEQSHTMMFSAAELGRRAAERPLAPFAIAESGTQPARSAAPLPGTPWGPKAPAPEPLDADMGDGATRAIRVKPRAPQEAPPQATPPKAAPPPAAPRRESAPEPPPRIGEVARIINASSLAAATLAWQVRPPRDSLTILVKGTFDLVPDGPARLRPESDLPIGDLHVDDDVQKSVAYASDFAVLKPKADVTAVGHAHAPGGSSPAAQVVFRFGAGKNRFERTLVVFGDRQWQRSIVALAPTAPKPFERMPLVYERAFGGPAYDRNPLGVGHQAAAGADGIARLPNVELPGARVTSPGDTPPPASFAPIPVAWKERWSKLGTYDRAWFKARWPYFPEDFDWAHFQSAPAPQQLDHLGGDEPYELAGMHPEHPSLRGRLPGVRARVFLQRTKEHGGTFTEVSLVLDTAAFDVDALKLNLVWRGFVEVSDEDAPEIQHVFVMSEALAGPTLSLEEARRRYLAEATPKEPVVEAPDAPAPANDDRPAREDADPELVKLEQMLADRTAARQAELEAAGVAVPGGPPPAPPPPDPAAIAASLRAGGASEADVASLLEALQPEPDAEPEPDPPAGRARAVALLEAGAPFDEVNLDGADLSDLDFSGRSLAGTSLRGADLRRARFAGAQLAGASLAEADLADAVLEDANLAGADLKRAKIDRARFTRATLDQADFSNAAGENATFAGATGTRPRFVEASLRGVCFDAAVIAGADFTGAALHGASFFGAELTAVRFYDATGEGAVFDEVKMPDARVEGASFPRGSFKEIQAEGAVFERAKLGGATFHGARLKGASLLRASCVKTVFSRADLSEGRLRRADLRGAALLKTNLMGANLERADLTGADLRGANLHSAGLWKANLGDAKLDGAILTKSTLAVRRPP
jgi:uncharacterized protein YjbI with pentapeptide repeats